MKFSKVNISIVFGIIILFLTGFFLFNRQSESTSNQNEANKTVATTMNHESPPDTHATKEGTMDHTEKNKKLQMKAQFTPNELILTNEDQNNWQECLLELNSTIVKMGYTFNQSPFQADDSINIPLNNFTRDGVSFDPTQSQAQNVMVMCSDNTGNSGWNYLTSK